MNLRERHDDIIWRVRWGDKWLYVYLLIEFQSSIDQFMKEAEARGEARGKARKQARGKVEGKVELVLNLLEMKFGVLPASIRKTIIRMDSEMLLKCSQRLLTANTVQEVIESSVLKGAS